MKKKLILLLAIFFCWVGVAGAWDDGGWDTSKVPYIVKTAAPTVNDDDFGVPYLWADTTNDKIYILIDNTTGAAVWQEVIYTGATPSFVTVDLTGVTDGNIPKMGAAGAGFGDSIVSQSGTTVSVAGSLSATDTLHGKIEIVDDDNSLSAAQCSGSLNKLTGAESTILPAAVAGMNVLLYSIDATVKTIAPNGNDHIWLNGVDNGATNSINSPGAVGDYIVFVAFTDNNWHTIGQSGTWIDTP